MNVPKLLRTTLFSVLALLLTGGLVAVQAQDTIFVDEDDPDNFDTIAAGIGDVDEDGDVVVVRAGGYGEDLTSGGSGKVSPGFDFTIEARTDDDSGADGVEIADITFDDPGQTVTVRSDGTGFLELAGSGTLTLENGTVDIAASRDFQLLGGATVERFPNGEISGSAPTFPNNVNVTYDLQIGNQAGGITAGLEAPANLGGGATLRIEDDQGGANSGEAVEFPSGRFGTVSADNLSLNDDVRADFRGDLEVDQAVTVGPNQSLTVAGELTIGEPGQGQINNGIAANADASSNSDEVSLGSLTLNGLRGGNTGIISGTGTLSVDGSTTFQVLSNNDGAFDTFVQSIVAVGTNTDFSFGSVEETTTGDGNATDETVVDIANGSGGAVELAGGSFRQLDQSANDGTFEVTGDVTTDVTGGFPVLNGGNGASIEITSGNTFTVRNDAPNTSNGAVTHNNSDTGNISGGGTIRFQSGQGESHVVNVSDNNANAGDDINRLPNVVVAGGNGATFNGENSSGNAIQLGGSLTGNADVTLSTPAGGARVGGATTVNGGTTNLTGVAGAVSTADAILNNSGTLNTNGNRLEIRRDFARNNSNSTLATNGSSTVAFTAGGTDGTFDTETLFTINGTVEVDKPDATITLDEAVRVNGDVEIVDQGQFLNTTFELGDNLFLQGGGQLTIDSNLDTQEGERVVFESAYTVAGDDTLGNAIVDGGADITVTPSASGNTNTTSLEFDGSVELRDGGITITSSEDFSPAGPDAEVIRTLDGSDGQQITANGTFNGDQNGYALTYRGGSQDQTTNELTDDVADLSVVGSGTDVLLDRNAEVNGALTVAQGAQINDNGSAQTLELLASDATHTINGQVEGTSGGNPITLDLAGENATISGGSGENANDAVVEDVLVSAAGAVIDGIQQVRGNLNVDSGDLQLGLREVNSPDQEVDGDVTVNDSLSLAADAEFTSGSSSDAVKVTSSGRINVATHELAVTGSGADFDGDSGAEYYSDNEDGIVILNGGSTPTLQTEGEAIPRLLVAQGIQLSGDAATDVLLDADADIALNGNAFDFSGRTELAADVTGTSSGSVFRALGTTILVEDPSSSNDRSVSNFEVDSDTSTVNLVNDTDRPFDGVLNVTNRFNMTSGTLDYAANMVLTGSLSAPGNTDEFIYEGGSFQVTEGYIVLRSGGASDPANTVASFDIEQDSTLSIPNLGVRDDAILGDEQNLVVTNDLRLIDDFDTSGDGGRLVIADGATIDRRAPNAEGTGSSSADSNPSADVLPEGPLFLSADDTYNLEYSGSGQPIRSGRELVGDADRIQNLTIDRNGSGSTDDVFFDSDPNVVDGDVTVNGTLNLSDGTLDYERQVVVVDSATVIRDQGALADVIDVENNSGADDTETGDSDDSAPGAGNPAPIEAPGFYTLVYGGDNIVGTSASITASRREFLSDGDVALETNLGIPPRFGGVNGSLDIPFNRTVASFTAANNTGGSTVGFTDGSGPPEILTVTGEATVEEGDIDDGILDTDGNALFAGGGITSGATLRAAEDVVVESGANLSAGTLEFDGTEQDLQLNGGPGTVGQLALSQQNGGDGRVFLTGDELVIGSNASNAIDFNSGLLVVPDSADGEPVDPSEVLVELSSVNGNTPGGRIPFDRSDVDSSDPDDQSHIVGRVRVGVPNGTPNSGFAGGNTRGRFEFPVGTEEEYRPAAFTFRSNDPTEVATDIVVQHIPENAGGTEGLPFDAGTDDEGNQVTIGENYPDQYWFVQATTGLGPSQQLDAEFETGTAGFVNAFEDASELRLIRRFSGDATQNRWRLQAGSADDAGDSYDNTLIQRDGSEFTQIRSRNSTGGLSANAALFTVGVPTEVTADLFQIAGTVTYPTVEDGDLTGGTGIEGAVVEASSADTTVTDTTDADGNYRITGLPSGDYDVEPAVSDSAENVSISDALRTVRAFAGIAPFAGSFQSTVADVTEDGTVNANDALQIARFDLGIDVGAPLGGFVTEDATVSLGESGAENVDLFAAEAGDADLSGGDASGSTSTLASTTLSSPSGGAVATQSASSEGAIAQAGETFEVPVRIDRSAEVGAYQVTVDFDAEKASFEGVKAAQDGVLANEEDGTVRVSWFDQSGESALDLQGGSELATLQFKASEGAEEADFAPEVKGGEITGPAAEPVSAGVELQAVTIGAPAPEEFALEGSYPNPVQGQATIEMDLPSKATVTVSVYNVLGQRVQTMEQSMSAGSGQTVQLDGSNFASGQYFYRVEADLEDGTARESGRITVVK